MWSTSMNQLARPRTKSIRKSWLCAAMLAFIVAFMKN